MFSHCNVGQSQLKFEIFLSLEIDRRTWDILLRFLQWHINYVLGIYKNRNWHNILSWLDVKNFICKNSIWSIIMHNSLFFMALTLTDSFDAKLSWTILEFLRNKIVWENFVISRCYTTSKQNNFSYHVKNKTSSHQNDTPLTKAKWAETTKTIKEKIKHLKLTSVKNTT